MTLKQLENLVKIDEDMTNPENGTYYNKRTIEQLLEYGLILIDKPPGPTSHEVVAWAKRILEIPKAGHSGTLDPQVSGVLPLGLGEGTKALGVLLMGPKEYHALGRLHSLPSKEKLEQILELFRGEIFQKPPQRSAVVRQTRSRTIYELELLEQKERLVLLRILCEAGTYIRKLYYDMGELLGPGGSMIELRRSRVHQFNESNLVTMHQLADAYATWKENKDDSKLLKIIRPVEETLSEIKSVVIRDSAIDSMCHGAQLAIPGVLQISQYLEKGDLVGIYSQKGEIVALAESLLSENEIKEQTLFPKGLLFAIILGVVSGPIFGIILYEYGVEDQLVYVDGTSLSIVTEKTNFTLGEPISITIVNSGTDELKFPDASYGLIIKQLDSIPIFSPTAAQVISNLDSHEDVTFVWDQIKNNGDHILEGTYKITVKANTIDDKIIEKIVTINIFK